MSTVPRLSIGLPVHNGEKYLAESLESLLGQTYEDFELIISDNASTDSTAEICRHYAKQDSRIRYIAQPRNIGLVANHNFVIEQASQLAQRVMTEKFLCREQRSIESRGGGIA